MVNDFNVIIYNNNDLNIRYDLEWPHFMIGPPKELNLLLRFLHFVF